MRQITKKLHLLLLAAFLYAPDAYSQAMPANKPKQQGSIEILADDALEWRRNENKFIATGDASASHEGTTIYADKLSADYQEGGGKNFDIRYLTAEGNVRIKTADSIVRGDRAVYDTVAQELVMTGEDLFLQTPEQKVTASGSFNYKTAEGRLTAVDNASVLSGEDTLSADRISAVFVDHAGKRRLQSATAEGNVVIKTPTEILYGDRGTYNTDSNVAEIIGNVRIERGPNILEGDRGLVNLTTNVSRLFGGTESGGRVRGIFYPDSGE